MPRATVKKITKIKDAKFKINFPATVKELQGIILALQQNEMTYLEVLNCKCVEIGTDVIITNNEGDYIKLKLKSKGLSSLDLATELDVSKQYVEQCLNGKRPLPEERKRAIYKFLSK